MSGTLRFIPKSPDLNKTEGYLTVEGSQTQHASGNYNLNGAINLPIVEGVLSLRLVGWKIYDSGYINQIRVGTLGLLEGVNDDDVAGGRERRTSNTGRIRPSAAPAMTSRTSPNISSMPASTTRARSRATGRA